MNCSEVQQRLSAYFDRELPTDVHQALAEHLDQCSECAAQLAGFQRLSSMAGNLTAPEPPDMWAELERQLDAGIGPQEKPSLAPSLPSESAYSPPASPKRGRWSSRMTWLNLVPQVAALVLLAIGVGYLVVRNWPHHMHGGEMTVSLESYLDTFQQDPLKAQQVLLASYASQQIDPAGEITQLPYRPAVSDLPPDYTLRSAYLVDMPCCKCVQAVFQRSDGTALSIFEHDKEQAFGYGKCTCTDMQCDGKAMCMIAKDERLAAARWEKDGRYITVIGARDVDEIALLMSHMSGSVPVDS